MIKYNLEGAAGAAEGRQAFKLRPRTVKKLPNLPNPRRLRRLHPLSNNQASWTRVVKHTAFLSPQEIELILDVVSDLNLPAYTSNIDEDIDDSGKPVHTTTYLNTDNNFRNHLPWLRQRAIELVRKVNLEQKWGFDVDSSSFNIRVAEYHEMGVKGSLKDVLHYDVGSLITLDIMLEEALAGAEFQTFDRRIAKSNHRVSDKLTLKKHRFKPGDALVFVSHKYHSVTPLERGRRKVLILEFWRGQEAACGHRCDTPSGECGFELDD